jgi:hypothetical protein
MIPSKSSHFRSPVVRALYAPIRADSPLIGQPYFAGPSLSIVCSRNLAIFQQFAHTQNNLQIRKFHHRFILHLVN